MASVLMNINQLTFAKSNCRLRKSKPALIEDAQVRRELLAFVNDPRTAVAALGAVATTAHSGAPDLLFHVWTATRERTDTTRLAEDLLFTKDVRANVSPALSIVLDLRDNRDCDSVRGILSRAIAHGDRRCLVALARLQGRTGCGAGQSEDCYPCLREGNELLQATDAAARRVPPSFE